MLQIHPVSYAAIRHELREIEESHPGLWSEIRADPRPPPSDTGQPHIQLGYNELAADELDRLLGYAGISQTNKPLGITGDFSPFYLGEPVRNNILIFPLRGLCEHLKEMAPEVYSDLERLGSMDLFVNSLGDKMTAVDYLVGGAIECINYCSTYRYALALRW